MDTLSRLIAGFALALWSLASVAAVGDTQWRGVNSLGVYTAWYDAPAPACLAIEYTHAGYTVNLYYDDTQSPGHPTCHSFEISQRGGSPPANLCTYANDCLSIGFVLSTRPWQPGTPGPAAPDASCSVGTHLSGWVEVASTPGAGAPKQICSGGCIYSNSGVGGISGSLAGKAFYGTPGENLTNTGTAATCDANAVANDGAAPPVVAGQNPLPLLPGTCPGTVNGVSVVVPCGSVSTTGSTTSAPSGSTSASSPPGAVVGETGTTETTDCTGGKCTTTTTKTVNNPNGTTTTTVDKKTEDQASFCKQNPNASICKTTTFGGSCSSVTCDGDAIQCAIARDQLARNCAMLDADSATSAFGVAAAAGLRPPDHPYLTGESVDLGSGGGFDKTDLLAGGCPADQSFQVAGGYPAVSIPFSRMCTPAAWLGNILVGLTALGCLGIVFVRGE